MVFRRALLGMLFALLASACASARADGPAGDAPASARIPYTRADVSFMQNMIAHHAQALAMTKLVAARTSRPELHSLAQRIDVSQLAEIERMRRWLQRRGESVPDTAATAHLAAGHGEMMPGMLTAAELTSLENARGVAFERMFLEFMIRHHEGAIRMVEQLLAAGGGQEPEVYMFANDVNADQSAEIRRMRALLATISG